MKKIEAIVVFEGKVSGSVEFKETTRGVLVSVDVKGLKKGKHGLHIHEAGNLSEGCKSCGSHFNPTKKNHGGLNSKIRHAGDFGNIEADSFGNVKDSFYAKGIRLRGTKFNIIGRSVVIHEGEDDLGKGGDEESLKTGNSGSRVACGVIGYKSAFYY